MKYLLESFLGVLVLIYLTVLWQFSGMTLLSFIVTLAYFLKGILFTMTMFKFPVLLMFLHFLGDFVFQSDNMAKNKSTSGKWLLFHVLTYGGVLSAGLVWFVSWTFLIKYVLVNILLHMYIDSVTSKIAKKKLDRGEVHNFFVVIGFDQFLHFVSLYATFWWLV